MINWLLARLLNIEPETYLMGIPGSVVYPEDYVVVDAPSVVGKIRAALFGTAPGLYMLNYRFQQLAAVVHSTPMAALVLERDSRQTYWPPRYLSFYDDSLFVDTATALSGSGSVLLSGVREADELAGRMHWRWVVEVVSETSVQIDAMDPLQDRAGYDLAVSPSEFSDPLQLPASQLQMQLQGAVGDRWLLDSLVRPVLSPLDLYARVLEVLGELEDRQLFGSEPAEPYLSLQNTWKQHSSWVYRLAAAVVASAMRTEDG